MKLYSTDLGFFVTSGGRELLRMTTIKEDGMTAWYDVTDEGFTGLDVAVAEQFEAEFKAMLTEVRDAATTV